jgi:hypothetical protein
LNNKLAAVQSASTSASTIHFTLQPSIFQLPPAFVVPVIQFVVTLAAQVAESEPLQVSLIHIFLFGLFGLFLFTTCLMSPLRLLSILPLKTAMFQRYPDLLRPVPI